ncbi:MAG: hypothetical protein M0R03_10615 [Novosphingobium sp.]|nr:hypothetical protein [Novosphingobium sp.]
MYDLIDRPVAALRDDARFLLWAMRGWAFTVERGTCPPLALCRGFASIDAQAALPDFHIAMVLLNRHGRDRIALAPLRCRRIVDHEAVLLALWRDLSLARFDKARATLALLVEDTAITPVYRALTAASAKLALAGCELSQLDLHENRGSM